MSFIYLIKPIFVSRKFRYDFSLDFYFNINTIVVAFSGKGTAYPSGSPNFSLVLVRYLLSNFYLSDKYFVDHCLLSTSDYPLWYF